MNPQEKAIRLILVLDGDSAGGCRSDSGDVVSLAPKTREQLEQAVAGSADADVDCLVEQLELNKVEDGDLDGLVHDAASSIGSAVNNGGLYEQVQFLLEQGFTVENIMAAVAEKE